MSERSVISADGTAIGYRSCGSGPGILVVGGALRSARDYADLAAHLAEGATVHLVDRRGRGASGPQGDEYGLEREVEDLVAVQAETGARWAIGHSYGGLVVLECLRRHAVVEGAVVYEPGVSAGPFPTAWTAGYRRRLVAGDERGAFAEFVRGSGGAPAVMRRMPLWYLKGVLRLGFRGEAWERVRALLPENLAEHEEVARRAGCLPEYAEIAAPVLVLSGSRSRSPVFGALADILPRGRHRELRGLDHFGPEGRSAGRVADAVCDFLAVADEI